MLLLTLTHQCMLEVFSVLKNLHQGGRAGVEELNISVAVSVDMKKIVHNFIEVACPILQNCNICVHQCCCVMEKFR